MNAHIHHQSHVHVATAAHMTTRTPAQASPGQPGWSRLLGFTLIETLVAISFGSSIMLAAIGLVHTALKLQAQSQTQIERTHSLARFVERFRCDSHAASGLDLPAPQALTLLLPNEQQIAYLVEANTLTRHAIDGGDIDGGDIDGGDVEQVEQVHLAPGHTARFELTEAGGCVVLEIMELSAKQSQEAPRLLRQVVAAVGSLSGAGGQLNSRSAATETASTQAAKDSSASASSTSKPDEEQ